MHTRTQRPFAALIATTAQSAQQFCAAGLLLVAGAALVDGLLSMQFTSVAIAALGSYAAWSLIPRSIINSTPHMDSTLSPRKTVAISAGQYCCTDPFMHSGAR